MKKQAVIYARYSSDKQTEQSIEGQLRVCYEFAESQGYEIQKEYIDRAMTGTNDNRPAFLQMINDSKHKEFQFVIVYKLDRFSRNTYDSTFYKHKLELNGVKVVSATEAISDTMEGKLIERILESMAEMYSVDLSQKVKRGMRESALKKQYLGGTVPLGYKVENKKLVINEDTAPLVKYAFEEYAKGTSQKDIITYLKNHALPSEKNRAFTFHQLTSVFNNTKYLGIFNFDGMVIEDYCPQLISQELFNKVQEKMKENKKFSAKNKAKELFLLTGHIFCGYCGSSLLGDSGTGRGGVKHTYYTCKDKKKKHTHCELKSIRKNTLEEEVISLTIKHLMIDKETIANKVLVLLKTTTDDYKIKEYENKLKKIEKEFDSVYNQFKHARNEALIDKLNKEADELTELKETYTLELKKLKRLNKVDLTKKDILNYIDMFMDLGKSDDIQSKQTFINTFVNVVYVFNDKTIIYINIDDSGNNNLVSFEDMKKDIETISSGSDIKKNGPPIKKNLVFRFFFLLVVFLFFSQQVYKVH